MSKKIVAILFSAASVIASASAAFAGDVSVSNTYTNGRTWGDTKLDMVNIENHVGAEWNESWATKVVDEVNIDADNYTETTSGGQTYSSGTFSGYVSLQPSYSDWWYGYSMYGNTYGNISLTNYEAPTTSTTNGSLNVSTSHVETGSASGAIGTYNSFTSVGGKINSFNEGTSFGHETTAGASNF